MFSNLNSINTFSYVHFYGSSRQYVLCLHATERNKKLVLKYVVLIQTRQQLFFL